jgi:5-methylcytosine-specific restriction protein B
VATIFRNQVLPLLQEYFFEDWQRIQWVLNDHRKAASDRFVYQSERDLRALFGGEAEVSVHNLPWRINEAAFGRASAYAGIIAVPAKVAAPLGVSEAAEA